jgi:hypothetical protein
MRKHSRVLVVFALGAVLSQIMLAGTVNIGFLDFSIPSTGQFDIYNQTGSNSVDALFPVTTPVPLSDLSLTVNFSNFTAETFGPDSAYFTPTGDLSFIGQPLATSLSVSSAILTGTFDETSLMLDDGSAVTVQPDFTAILEDPSGTLQDGDYALIEASTIATPEPPMVVLMACFLCGLPIYDRRRSRATRTNGTAETFMIRDRV